MNLSFLPNLITLIRIILLIPLSIFLYRQEYSIAFYIFMIAGFSDALDGYLAKKFSWVSRFGAILDPLADKALLVITMAFLTFNGEIHWVLFLLVMWRDLHIVAGAYLYHRLLGPYEMHPSNLSKFNTFVQLLLVTSTLFSLGYKTLPDWYLELLTILTYITTISSGIHYTWVWGGKAKVELARRKAGQKPENTSE